MSIQRVNMHECVDNALITCNTTMIQKILNAGNLPLVFEGVRNLKPITHKEPIVLSCTVGVSSSRHLNTSPDQMALISISTTYQQGRRVPTSDAEDSQTVVVFYLVSNHCSHY